MPKISEQHVIAFHGQMGAGKTTFITALCKALGVEDAISSPTYSIINEYKTNFGNTIYHMDWYRLKKRGRKPYKLVWKMLCTVVIFAWWKWPEMAPNLLPENTLHLIVETINENERKNYF